MKKKQPDQAQLVTTHTSRSFDAREQILFQLFVGKLNSLGADALDAGANQETRNEIWARAERIDARTPPKPNSMLAIVSVIQTVLLAADRDPFGIKHPRDMYAHQVLYLYFLASRIEGIKLPEFPDAEEMSAKTAVRHLEVLRQSLVALNARPDGHLTVVDSLSADAMRLLAQMVDPVATPKNWVTAKWLDNDANCSIRSSSVRSAISKRARIRTRNAPGGRKQYYLPDVEAHFGRCVKQKP